ncbi:MAG: HEAT repeat protein [Myxococcota bacterium]|jgi:HEAT repeat protein
MRASSVLIPLLALGCAAPAEESTVRPAAERLERALIGPSDECRRSTDCASTVCVDGFCTPLTAAGQTWMEAQIGTAVGVIITEEPALVAELLGSYATQFAAEDPFTRGRFAGMLGHVGSPRAIPLLEDWAASPVERIASRSILALGRLSAPGQFSAVASLVDHRSESVVLAALDSVSAYAGVDRDAVCDLLSRALEDSRTRVRQRAIRILGRTAKDRPAVIESLKEILADPGDGYLHYDVVRALSRLGHTR